MENDKRNTVLNKIKSLYLRSNSGFLIVYTIIIPLIIAANSSTDTENNMMDSSDLLLNRCLWASLVLLFIYEVVKLIKNLRSDNDKLFRVICWTRFGVMSLLCFLLVLWNLSSANMRESLLSLFN